MSNADRLQYFKDNFEENLEVARKEKAQEFFDRCTQNDFKEVTELKALVLYKEASDIALSIFNDMFQKTIDGGASN